MNAWGYDIFDNDEAADVRALFERELNNGASIAHATAVVLHESADALQDPEAGPIVWLALATLQLHRKTLQPEVRDHALAVIEGGEDLKRWEAEASPEDAAGRKRVLDDLRERLVALA
ncbi:MAG: DUF4259 domain-containing protein [Thermomicrobiales bacterium]